MSKPFNPRLDHVSGYTDRAINETHGDMILEGRHGNSIRIGSRHINPYVMISNGRNPINKMENLADGSLISITNNGTLWEHFGDIATQYGVISGFVFSSDLVSYYRKIANLSTSKWEHTDGADVHLYGYSATLGQS